MHSSNRFAVMCLLAAALVLTGCASEDSGAIVEVKWSIGGTTCSQVGVTHVRITLLLDGAAKAERDAPCSDGNAEVSGVPAGTFVVRVLGFQGENPLPSHVGQVTGVVVPKDARVSAPAISLQEAPGAIDLKWRFESGDLCRFMGVDWVQVSIFDERLRTVADQGMSCNPAPEVGVPSIPDGAEYLADSTGIVFENLFSGPHDIVVLGYRESEDDVPIYFGTAQVEVNSFELTAATILLVECDETATDSLCN
ncbi:MAG: hypothetical protein ACI9OJ_001716 [Myxococcota bacterium]|jgi:hypothetical protein